MIDYVASAQARERPVSQGLLIALVEKIDELRNL